MKSTTIFGIILAFIMIGVGIMFPMPEKDIDIGSGYDYKWSENKGSKYVGGDAYNYQMEASLKAGWVAGVIALKTISITAGIILFMLSLISNVKIKELEAQTELLRTIANQTSQNFDNKTGTEINNNLPVI